MTFADIYNECVALRFNSQATKLAQVKKWVNQAEIGLWNAAPWTFKKVAAASLTVTADDSTPTMPGDFGKAHALYDHNGQRLRYLPEEVFDELYLADTSQGVPCDYKLVNRVITLGPIPQSTYTFKLPYRRRYAHLNGGNVVAGVMSADADTPLWDSEHHYILVPWAIRIGKLLEDDPTAAGLDVLVEELKSTSMFRAMLGDLVGEEEGEMVIWGSGYQESR